MKWKYHYGRIGEYTKMKGYNIKFKCESSKVAVAIYDYIKSLSKVESDSVDLQNYTSKRRWKKNEEKEKQ